MKKSDFWILLLAGTLANSACTPAKPKENTAASTEVVDTAGPVVMDELETQAVAVEERPSDMHLLAALDNLAQKKNQQAAGQIKEGIAALKQETAGYPAKSKPEIEQTLRQLETLQAQVSQGKLTGIEPLQKAVAKAQNLVAHQVFYAVEETLIPEKQPSTASTSASGNTAPGSTASRLTTALGHLKRTVEKDTSALKDQGQALLTEGQAMEARLKTGEKVEQAQLKAYLSRCHAWLEKHAGG
jgi:hypothetical protein